MAKRVPEGPAPDPAVQKLRVRYAKRGRLRFSSTRDFQRALERAVRRADVPVAFSAGFHPHPRISYANAAPTGTASEAEYFEISVTERVSPQALRAALHEALPEGIDVLEVAEARPGALADRLEASRWALRFTGVPLADLHAAVQLLMSLGSVEVTRMMKRGPRTFDVRSAVLAATVAPAEAGDVELLVVIRHDTPTVRPGDVLAALQGSCGLAVPRPPLITREVQGTLAAGPQGEPVIGSPLA